MTTMEILAGECDADRGTSQTPMTKNKYMLSKAFAEFSPNQRLNILKRRLNFLRQCKPLKRPPPSLRIHGASALTDLEKLAMFSQLETLTLEVAINNKLN